jgi:hypothetical protein
MQAKEKWVLDNYGIQLDNYCVGTINGKIEIMKAISSAFNINRENIMLVDDIWDTLDKATAEGFSACTPMEIVNYIEELHKNNRQRIEFLD